VRFLFPVSRGHGPFDGPLSPTNDLPPPAAHEPARRSGSHRAGAAGRGPPSSAAAVAFMTLGRAQAAAPISWGCWHLLAMVGLFKHVLRLRPASSRFADRIADDPIMRPIRRITPFDGPSQSPIPGATWSTATPRIWR